MSVGKRIRKYRKQAGLTQAQLAELLSVSFQAVSSWENDEYLPDPERLTEIAHHMSINVGKLLEEDDLSGLARRDKLADESHMHTMLKTSLRLGTFPLAYRALVHIEGTCGETLEPARHAMHLACHALALGVGTDEVLELLLYYGLWQEKNQDVYGFPSSPACKAMLHQLTTKRDLSEAAPAVCVARCIDSVYGLSVAAIGGDRAKMIGVVEDAEENVLPLLRTVKNTVPEWNNAVYLLRYQMLALLETYKRLM